MLNTAAAKQNRKRPDERRPRRRLFLLQKVKNVPRQTEIFRTALIQRHMVLHHPPKQRQTRAHKTVFHFKTGPLVQTDTQQTVPSAHAGGPAHRPGELVAAVTRYTGKASPIVGNPGGKGPVALVRILSARSRLSKTYATSLPCHAPCG